jgi:hypothetical protein
MISVPEMLFVPRKVRSLVFCEAMAGNTMPSKPSKMTTATSEMAASTSEMAASTAEASTMPTTEASTSSTMATASSTMCERGGGRERQNAGQNQTDK